MSLKLLLIQLNEINFEIVNKYLSVSNENKFINLKHIKKNYKFFETYSENKYENLEPWIQWTSVYLGKKYDQHRIFRLGDIVNFPKEKQIFEKIENRGFKVGAISPMNAENRLKNPSYFIPDPWTNTHSDSSTFSKKLTQMLRQSVNDNSNGNLSFKSILTIIEIIFKTINLSRSLYLFKLIFSSILKPWKKSLILDYLIHLIHLYFLEKKNTNFSSVFFNAGSHIQHHYLFNYKHIKQGLNNPKWYIKSSADPIEDMLEVYDKIIGDYLELSKNKNELIISTGLRQIPYDRLKFYYRLKNHEFFLNKIGLKFLKVLPRMTRDFEIIFNDNNDSDLAKKILLNIKSLKDDLKIFSEIEERDKSLFVTLTYPNEIKKDSFKKIENNLELKFIEEVTFVAIKNGMPDTKGYVFLSSKYNIQNLRKPSHISVLSEIILNYFQGFSNKLS